MESSLLRETRGLQPDPLLRKGFPTVPAPGVIPPLPQQLQGWESQGINLQLLESSL